MKQCRWPHLSTTYAIADYDVRSHTEVSITTSHKIKKNDTTTLVFS